MTRAVLSLVALALATPPVTGQEAFDWRTATPESHGFSKEKLDALKDDLAKRGTKAFLVIRADAVVYEWYAEGHGADKLHYTASLAKALVGGMSLAVALTDGKMFIDDSAAKFVPQWKGDKRKAKITIRHLGSHTSGLADAEENGLPHEKLTGWKGDFWKRRAVPDDPFTIARDNAPVLFDPGAKLQYSNPGIGMLTYCVTAAMKDTKWKDARTILRERVLAPIGVPDREWSCGYGSTFTVDGLPLVGSWGGGNFTARAAARVGRLVLREGDWNGKQILSRDAVKQVATSAGLPGECGMGWWTNAAGRYAYLPRDAVWGAGAGDQILLVVPSLKLIVVRNGQTLTPAAKGKDEKDVFTAYHDPRAKVLFEPLIAAMLPQPANELRAPYPASKVITSVEWAPRDTILRAAKGSDNWPLTWADDDAMYTAYGDGKGFEPFTKEKLSLGLARVSGEPAKFTGVNLRAETVERTGDGAKGPKASGILMVDGVLYLLVRNTANAQLAWSRDRGRTWEWADWKFATSFGCPTFLNFGKDYAGARDDFVYIYSHDAASAYTPADRMVLARVPKDRIRDRAAYEFFQRLDAKGEPVWSKQIADRGAVFIQPGRCCRSGITYNAGLKRYLWVQIIPGTEGKKTDTRFAGGFGIYDAVEPWGPWTTAYFTDQWDVGPGETASFPAKWMSRDGRELHLVFSGDDSFSVRRATLK